MPVLLGSIYLGVSIKIPLYLSVVCVICIVFVNYFFLVISWPHLVISWSHLGFSMLAY